jgi:hypothetical protein
MPRASGDAHAPDSIAHGALLVGGTFTEVANFDPMISLIVTEETYLEEEFDYPDTTWYPAQLGTINRFLSIEGEAREQLVVVPGQFRARNSDSTPTIGVQRLYTQLDFEVYHAPVTVTDFVPSSIWGVQALSTTERLSFRVYAGDADGQIARAVVLYRETDEMTWHTAELTRVGMLASGIEIGQVFVAPVTSPIYYFIQTVDDSGNVIVELNHGMPYTKVIEEGTATPPEIYLPLVVRN